MPNEITYFISRRLLHLACQIWFTSFALLYTDIKRNKLSTKSLSICSAPKSYKAVLSWQSIRYVHAWILYCGGYPEEKRGLLKKFLLWWYRTTISLWKELRVWSKEYNIIKKLSGIQIKLFAFAIFFLFNIGILSTLSNAGTL